MPADKAVLRELASIFARLGATAFGGPAAHIALMKREVVERRKWLTADEFLDLVGATSLIPGPTSTELAIHVGHRRAGLVGSIVAGSCFIVPAALVTLFFAWLYVRYGQLPPAEAILWGMKPVIVAIVAHALWSLSRTAMKGVSHVVIGILGVLALALGAGELAVLAGAGVAMAALAPAPAKSPTTRAAPMALIAAPGAIAATTAAVTTGGIFLVFLKIGSVLFGSGYVLIAFLRADLVEARGWLTEGQLIDAIAVGQVTPGPLFTTATFVGYLLNGFPGALAATVGIFLPAFVFVAVSGPLVQRIRRSARAGAALDGLNVASLAMMLVVTFDIGRATFLDMRLVAVGVASLAVLLASRISPIWLLAAGAAVGLAVRL